MFIVTKEIDSGNIRKLCRTCLREDGEKMVCLFVGPAGSSLAAKLRSLSCLEVWQGDGLPEKLCDRCVTRAESALLYREQCRAADRALRQAASKVSREHRDAATAVSHAKFYHPQEEEQHDFASTKNLEKSAKCTDRGGPLFGNYQELCARGRAAHPPFVQGNRPVQHMNIVESQNVAGYVNADSTLEKGAAAMPLNVFMPPPIAADTVSLTKNDRAACALDCSLCNRTYTDRRQLMNRDNLTHRNNQVESRGHGDATIATAIRQDPNLSQSLDNANIDGMSYDQRNDPTTMEAVNYSAAMSVLGSAERNIAGSDGSLMHNSQSMDSDASSGASSDRILRGYPGFSDVVVVVGAHGQCDESTRRRKNGEFSGEESSNLRKKQRRHRCNACDKSFSQKSKLITHTLRHTGERPFGCSSCGKAYTSRSKLNAHARLHTETNVHRCSVCDKTFPYPSYLAEHARVHKIGTTGNRNCSTRVAKEFECSICKKQFRLAKNLKAHSRLHTGSGLLRCEICHKTFGQKYNLKVHLRTHNVASKILECNYCGKSFSARGNFVEHLRIHTKLKPFECRLCRKTFSQSSHLKTHEVTHNSLRPHQCGLCGKRYKLAAHLRRHSASHTTDKAYKCEQCDQMFSQAFSLKRHLRRHNNNDA